MDDARLVDVVGGGAGALLGLAIGDALGTTLEFESLAAPPFPELATGPHIDITGGGPFAVAPGQVTDDTQMAAALRTSLHACAGHDPVDVAARYVDWRRYAFDIGGQTSNALARIAAGDAPLQAGRNTWEASGCRAAGNGSLMRTAPIAVYFARDAQARRRASIDDSAITHFDPRCMLACAAFNAAVATAMVADGAAEIAEVFDAAAVELDEAAVAVRSRWPDIGDHVAAARDALVSDLTNARAADPALYADGFHLHATQGFVRVAFRLAFWELAHAPSFSAGVIDAVNRGGDADTNGAITGALLGAYYTAKELPGAWVRAVLEALPVDPSNPLTTRYHPRALFRETAGFLGDDSRHGGGA